MSNQVFRLQSPLTDYYLSKSFFPNLRSIDLSENNLTDLESFIHYTRKVFHSSMIALLAADCTFKCAIT